MASDRFYFLWYSNHMTSFVNTLFGILTIIAQVIVLLSLYTYFFGKGSRLEAFFLEHAHKNGFLVAFIVASAALVGSLTYSNMIGYEPCTLCWWQRIFMYPIVPLLVFAFYKKDIFIRPYIILMSVLGGIIALDHYVLQITGTSLIPCSAVGYSSSCAKNFVLQFGYITIPLMALSAFVLIITALLWHKKAELNSNNRG